jgi:hypothetical protein
MVIQLTRKESKDGKIIKGIDKIKMANLIEMVTTEMVIIEILITKIVVIDKEEI